LVEHCVGPLGVGALVVKPRRHVLHVADLDDAEVAELGPLLQKVAATVTVLTEPEQVYVTLWSHADAVPGHIHWVVQPVTASSMLEHGGLYGPRIQVEMFDRGVAPPAHEVEVFCDRARAALSR
jgi:diadenosine tetraphosphate (Ap4A) HIT family hydrolase